MLHEAAAFELQGTLLKDAVQNDSQFVVMQRIDEKLVGTGLARLEGDGAGIGSSDGDDDDVVADFADLFENVDPVGGAVADAIEIKDYGVKIRALEGLFDLVLRVGQRDAQFVAEALPNFGIERLVVGDYCQRIAFGTGGAFGQGRAPRNWPDYR